MNEFSRFCDSTAHPGFAEPESPGERTPLAGPIPSDEMGNSVSRREQLSTTHGTLWCTRRAHATLRHNDVRFVSQLTNAILRVPDGSVHRGSFTTDTKATCLQGSGPYATKRGAD